MRIIIFSILLIFIRVFTNAQLLNFENKHDAGNDKIVDFQYSYGTGFSPKSLNDSIMTIINRLNPETELPSIKTDLLSKIKFPNNDNILVSIEIYQLSKDRKIDNPFFSVSWAIPTKKSVFYFTDGTSINILPYGEFEEYKYSNQRKRIQTRTTTKNNVQDVVMNIKVINSKIKKIEGLYRF